ncbi:hypothetical protein EC991_011264 [Linnemannia zychae]|nr:hypothetical protein EC991_011264 [Linnemannia zychae]
MIEFLGQLITALDHFLVPNQQGSLGSANTGGRSGTATAAANATATKSKTRSASTAGLSVELVQLNTGIVYEILEECMSLGYPMMPSLVQLDLLIFGVPKTTS